ncbi:hypothetical protein ACJMK2_014018, partial [Sinanodonta woodiana]
IFLEFLNPGKRFKRLGYEKRKKAENLEHIMEANLAECAIQIWSPPSEKNIQNANIQCQTNFKSLLLFRNRHVQKMLAQCSLVKLDPLHMLSSDMTEDPE